MAPRKFGVKWVKFDRTPESRSSAKGSSYPEEAWPHECRCAEEAVAADEAALGTEEDEAKGEGEVGQAVVRSRSLAVPQGFFLLAGRHRRSMRPSPTRRRSGF